MEVKPGYKLTEVGLIPKDWDVKPLKHISPRQSVGLVINPSTYYDKAGTVPLLLGSHVHENAIDATAANRISESSNRQLAASRLDTGDLVTVRVGEPGTTAVVPLDLDGCNCASMMIVRRHPSFDSHWLCAAMNSRIGRGQVEKVQYGTAQKQFNISHAVDFCFGVPPLPEQRAIAEALGDVDALLGGLDRLIAKKRDLTQAAMQQLLTGQTRLADFVEKWETKTLGSFLEIKKGELITEAYAVRGSIPVVAGGKQPAYFHNRANRSGKTITISGSGASAGFVAFYASPIFASDCSTISEGKGYSLEFVYFLLRGRQDELYRAQTGGAQPHIHPNDLRPFVVSVPKSHEQASIAAVFSDMDAELAALEQRRDKIRDLKQAMAQDLLTGRTRLV
jgi:type I restriction enzyme S subunit